LLHAAGTLQVAAADGRPLAGRADGHRLRFPVQAGAVYAVTPLEPRAAGAAAGAA